MEGNEIEKSVIKKKSGNGEYSELIDLRASSRGQNLLSLRAGHGVNKKTNSTFILPIKGESEEQAGGACARRPVLNETGLGRKPTHGPLDTRYGKLSASYGKLAFTLVELIVVIVILAVLSTVGFMSYNSYIFDAKQVVKISDMKMIDTAINTDDGMGNSFNLGTAKPITFAAHPNDVVSYVGPLEAGMIHSLTKTPRDPFTKKPYIVGIYPTGNLMQVATAFQKKKYLQVGDEQSTNKSIPIQRVVGNYKPNDIEGVSGLIPRWAVENFDSFKQTAFYTTGKKMFGSFAPNTPGIGKYNNNYIFAINDAPLTQVAGYTDGKTLLYESFENQKISIVTDKGFKENGFKKFPGCFSSTISQTLAFESNTVYTDQIQTIDCSIDATSGVASKSSLHLNWLRDSNPHGDGNYAYLLIDPKKKYKGYFDVKGKVTGSLHFVILLTDNNGVNLPGKEKTFTPTLSETTFQRVNFYVNTPDPSGNGLSLNFPADMEGYGVFLFFRRSSLKTGDKLWFDNFVVEELP